LTGDLILGGNLQVKGGSPWYDVKAYGAKGDGTTDDGAAILDAYNAAPEGGTVFFPAGVYKFATGFVLGDKSITLQGTGAWNSDIANVNRANTPPVSPANSILYYTGAGIAFTTNSGAGTINFDRLTLWGTPSALHGIWNASAGYGSHLFLTNCRFTDFSGGQTTTLNGSITAGQTTITITSATGFPSSGTYLIEIDGEIMQVQGGQGTATWTVGRGRSNTTAFLHSNGATVKWGAVAVWAENYRTLGVDQCFFTYNYHSLLVDAINFKPYIQRSTLAFNTDWAIRCLFTEFDVSSCYFRANAPPQPVPNDAPLVWIYHCSMWHIAGCGFDPYAVPTAAAVVIEGDMPANSTVHWGSRGWAFVGNGVTNNIGHTANTNNPMLQLVGWVRQGLISV